MRNISRRAIPPATLPAIAAMIAVAVTASCGARHDPAAAGDPAAAPHAIISLSATGTEMLYAIGAGRQVRAVDKYSDYPTGAPRTSMSELTANVEAIAARRPDLVVIDSEAAPSLAKQLAGLRIPVLVLPAAANLADVYAQLATLGRATGHLEQARAEERAIRTQIAAIVASLPHRSRPLTYYYELTTNFYSVTSGTFVGRLLGLLGLKSIAGQASGAGVAGGYPQLSAETILKADPDYIFLADRICCRQNARTVAARPGWRLLKAVREGHVVGLNDDIASRWGPRIVDLLRTVAAALRHGRGRP